MTKMIVVLAIAMVALISLCGTTQAFHLSNRSIRLSTRVSDANKAEPDQKFKLSFGKLVQLIGMGAGAPMLGEFKGVDERGALQFELEANNYGKELESVNFLDGQVDKFGDLKPPGFFANLASGGKLQSEWDEKIKDRLRNAPPPTGKGRK